MLEFLGVDQVTHIWEMALSIFCIYLPYCAISGSKWPSVWRIHDTKYHQYLKLQMDFRTGNPSRMSGNGCKRLTNMLQPLWTRCWWPRKQILCRNGLCLDQWVWTRIPCRSPFTRDVLLSKFAKHVLFAKVSEEEARELADELNLRYLETSAKHA